MKRFLGKTAIILGVLSITLLALLYPKLSSMKSEYVTANIIGEVAKHVETHHGAWPKSWADLGDGKDYSGYTIVRFDLTTEQILKDTNVIFTSILPISKRYLTYPHAQRQLEALQQSLVQARTNGLANP